LKIKEEIDKAEKEKCPFRPQIIKHKDEDSKAAILKGSKQTGDRCQNLYDLAKKAPKKQDVATDDYVYEKEKQEYTFAPNIVKEKPVESQDINAGLIAETIERLQKGRMERERIKQMMERNCEETGMKFEMETSKFKKPSSEFTYSGSKRLSASVSKTLKESSAQKTEPKFEPNPTPEAKLEKKSEGPQEIVVQQPSPISVP